MYRTHKIPDETFTLENGSRPAPIATLSDEHGGRAQIFNDDHCYVLALLQEGGRYRMTSWWFREAVSALQALPLPE